MPFENRADAGWQLAEALSHYRGADAVVLALPRGGVPVAAEVAGALGAPLDLVLVRKVGAPFQEELAIAAVADAGAPVTVRNEDVIAMIGIDDETVDQLIAAQITEIDRRRALYLAGRKPVAVAGRVAIVIDDGVATGATTRAALRAVRAGKPRRLVLAVPVGPVDTIAELGGECDEIVCLEQHALFGAIGYYYADFRQVDDQDVIDALAKFSAAPTLDA